MRRAFPCEGVAQVPRDEEIKNDNAFNNSDDSGDGTLAG